MNLPREYLLSLYDLLEIRGYKIDGLHKKQCHRVIDIRNCMIKKFGKKNAEIAINKITTFAHSLFRDV